jgi:hypothetical protein
MTSINGLKVLFLFYSKKLSLNYFKGIAKVISKIEKLIKDFIKIMALQILVMRLILYSLSS